MAVCICPDRKIPQAKCEVVLIGMVMILFERKAKSYRQLRPLIALYNSDGKFLDFTGNFIDGALAFDFNTDLRKFIALDTNKITATLDIKNVFNWDTIFAVPSIHSAEIFFTGIIWDYDYRINYTQKELTLIPCRINIFNR
jgi:hypothetical protein